VGCPHWGFEFRHFPEPATRRLAHCLAAVGFDLLVGHHPHVVQPLELAAGCLCLYSAGNLLGPAIPLSWPMRLGVALEVDLGVFAGRRPQVARYEIHPLVQLAGASGPAVVPVAAAPASLRRRLDRRLGLLYA
jgi:poly-gamma-glutamate synthesis protein (capsule biosynthesis protein)